MIIETKKLADLKPAPYNARKSNKKQEADLKKSLEKFGVVEPIIYNQKTGYIVGGHFRVRELKKLGYSEVDCVVVDLNTEDEKELNIRLNANTGDWDIDMLLGDDWEQEKLEDWGLSVKGVGEDDIYTKKVKAPIYEITGLKPELEDLIELDKTKKLIENIEKANIDEKMKEFLKYASYRHIVFDYGKIAEFYAHCDRETQELMEENALIIIDYEKAIENGYMNSIDEVGALFINENEND